jgi:hypothetical protein
MGGDRDELWGVASAATFARCMLRKDHPAARMIFDQVTADREELLAFATGLVSLANAVLTGMHGMRLADRYLADVAGQAEL